jgi:hypothetical protein
MNLGTSNTDPKTTPEPGHTFSIIKEARKVKCLQLTTREAISSLIDELSENHEVQRNLRWLHKLTLRVMKPDKTHFLPTHLSHGKELPILDCKADEDIRVYIQSKTKSNIESEAIRAEQEEKNGRDKELKQN